MHDTPGVIERIKKARTVLIVGHISPDGDAIASGLAIKLGLKKMGIDAYLVAQKVPNFLKFLPVDEISDFDDIKDIDFDLVIALDTSTPERLEKEVWELIRDPPGVCLINIDHHSNNSGYGDYNLINSEASSTCEIVFDLLKQIMEIDLQMAECLYCGIITDTGSFAHAVGPHTFFVAHQLINMGVDNEKIRRLMSLGKSEAEIRLLGWVLSNYKFVDAKGLAYCFIPSEKIEDGMDTKKAAGILLSQVGCTTSLILKDKDDQISGSFRSKVSIKEIATLLGGGGHPKAASFITNKSVNEIIKIVTDNL